MSLIKRVVKDVIDTGYLTNRMEKRLKRLFDHGCDLTDLDALAQLQQAVNNGCVKRLSCQEARQQEPLAYLENDLHNG